MRKIGFFDIYVDDMDRAQAFYETVLDTTLTPIGEHGFVSLITDTEGNMVGLHSPVPTE